MDYSKKSSQSLAAGVIVYRALKINKEHATKCMEELMTRRNNGDNFNYEKYIEEKLKLFPKSQNLEKNNMFNILKQVKNFITPYMGGK